VGLKPVKTARLLSEVKQRGGIVEPGGRHPFKVTNPETRHSQAVSSHRGMTSGGVAKKVRGLFGIETIIVLIPTAGIIAWMLSNA
jgi:hypothetical protein